MIDLINFKYNKVGIFGLARSGEAALKIFHLSGIDVIAYDDNPQIISKFKNIDIYKDKIVDLNDNKWKEIQLLILSPGIPLNYPKPHKVVELARNNGAEIICDIEVLYRSNKNAKYIGITGTNGKSTTSSLIYHILHENGINTEIGGNIGVPALSLKYLDQGVYVLEMSSYQLELTKNIKFDIAVILNITPDHLDRHGNMENYINAKRNIFNHQGLNDFKIICVDNENTNKIYQELTGEKVIPISAQKILDEGVSLLDGIIYYYIDGKKDKYFIGELDNLPGEHNAENIVASFTTCMKYGMNPKNIINSIKSFGGLEHRIEFVGIKDGIKFINDSKATNAESTSKALKCFNNIYLIAGGVAKEGGISSLTEYFSKIKHVFLIGKSEEEFAKFLEGKLSYTKCRTLENAVIEAYNQAKNDKNENPIVLLSPACASLDQFKNFEERGDKFKEIFRNL